MTEFYRALISATTKEEAQAILITLVEKRLAAGGLITSGSSIYWWNKKIEERLYYNLSTFTISKNKKKIIEEIKRIHKDKIPIVTFFKIEGGNEEFLRWVEENVR